MSGLEQIERIISSKTLHGAGTLCHVLHYLAEQATKSPATAVKEYQIATEVLGRSADFDPRADSTVRVTVARLRTKLAEYYETEGKDDPISVEIPKGSYRVLFRSRGLPLAAAQEFAELAPEVLPPAHWLPSRFANWPAAALLALLACAAGALVGYRLHPAAKEPAAVEPPAALRKFWSGFTAAADRPIVVYSNAPFVGNASSGLRYFDPKADARADLVQTYTGVGEVMAVYALAHTFWQLNQNIEVKRGGLLGWDEVKNANLIFVGGPTENLPVRELRELRSEGEFVFEPLEPSRGSYGAVVVNRRPGPGEQAVYDASKTNPGMLDYAVIRFSEGFSVGRQILMLAGVTTEGTQGAVEFACRNDRLEELLTRLGAGAADPIKPFECLLAVEIKGNVPIDSHIVALRNAPVAATESTPPGKQSL